MTQRCTFPCTIALGGLAAAAPPFKDVYLNQSLETDIQAVAMADAR